MKPFPGDEIVSFNDEVLELSELLELDGAALDAIVGGMVQSDSLAASDTTCSSFKGSCSDLVSCGTYSFQLKAD